MYTTHAKVRMQQRGIPSRVVELLLDYGERVPAHRGAEIFYFGDRGRSRVRLKEGPSLMRRLEEYLRDYVVVADGQVVTCGKRYQPIRRS